PIVSVWVRDFSAHTVYAKSESGRRARSAHQPQVRSVIGRVLGGDEGVSGARREDDCSSCHPLRKGRAARTKPENAANFPGPWPVWVQEIAFDAVPPLHPMTPSRWRRHSDPTRM